MSRRVRWLSFKTPNLQCYLWLPFRH